VNPTGGNDDINFFFSNHWHYIKTKGKWGNFSTAPN